MSQGNPSPENSARNDGGYGEEEGENDWESDFEAEEEMPPAKKHIEGCFNPLGTNNSKIWELNQSQNEFVGEYFSEWLSDGTVKQSILEENPVPNHDSLSVLQLDEEILDLLRTGA